MASLLNSETRPKDENQGVEAILKAASNYPFRPDARHFIVLFTGPRVSTDIWDSCIVTASL